MTESYRDNSYAELSDEQKICIRECIRDAFMQPQVRRASVDEIKEIFVAILQEVEEAKLAGEKKQDLIGNGNSRSV